MGESKGLTNGAGRAATRTPTARAVQVSLPAPTSTIPNAGHSVGGVWTFGKP